MAGGNLIYYAIVFLVVAVGAAVFGFGGISATAESAARIIFYVAIVLVVVSLVVNYTRR